LAYEESLANMVTDRFLLIVEALTLIRNFAQRPTQAEFFLAFIVGGAGLGSTKIFLRAKC